MFHPIGTSLTLGDKGEGKLWRHSVEVSSSSSDENSPFILHLANPCYSICLFLRFSCLPVKISCNTSARHLIFCFHHLAILKGQKQKHECSRKHKRIIDMKLHEIALMKKFQNFRIVVYRRFYAMRKKQRQTSTNISWSQPKTRLVHPGDS